MQNRSRLLSLLALMLFTPAPTVGVLLALHSPQGSMGAILWAMAKIWLFALPALWYLWIEKQAFSLSKPKNGGITMGFAVGILMLLVIFIAFWLFGKNAISPDLIRSQAQNFGLNRPLVYLAAALYWICINSLLEEYIFRFFFYRQLENLFNIKWLAVILAAAIFTLHHTVVLTAYLPVLQNALASLGIFIAGVIWSAMYARYRSVWIPFISHLWADIAVFSIGAYLIFMA